MKSKKQKNTYTAIIMLLAFVLWTILIRFVDVQTIGPNGSAVGLATVNQFVRQRIGVRISLYVITDWLSLVPISFVMIFALLGLGQWIKRKQIAKVDRDILVLGGFYAAVMAAYCIFEMIPVNYRPVLINGYTEASYPSSTTMLVLCVMSTAVMQLNARIGNVKIRHCVTFAITVFAILMVGGRLLSGVHWFTDIVGGILLSAGLVKTYQIFAFDC